MLQVADSWFILLDCHSPLESSHQVSCIRVIVLHTFVSSEHVNCFTYTVTVFDILKKYMVTATVFLPFANYLTYAVTVFVCHHWFSISLQRLVVNAKLHFCTRWFNFQSSCFSSILFNDSDGWTGLCVFSSSTSVWRTRPIMSRRWISSDFMGVALAVSLRSSWVGQDSY